MEQYRGVVKKHTSFTLDLLRVLPDSSTFRYSSNFRQASCNQLITYEKGFLCRIAFACNASGTRAGGCVWEVDS